jgi:hypothetical protein
MSDPWRRERPCVDHAGRPRTFTITVVDGQVAVHAPPPGTAGFHPEGIGEVRQDLLDAQAEAIQQRGGFR